MGGFITIEKHKDTKYTKDNNKIKTVHEYANFFLHNTAESNGTIISSAERPPWRPTRGFSFSAHHR